MVHRFDDPDGHDVEHIACAACGATWKHDYPSRVLVHNEGCAFLKALEEHDG